jgi:hypothetical protein
MAELVARPPRCRAGDVAADAAQIDETQHFPQAPTMLVVKEISAEIEQRFATALDHVRRLHTVGRQAIDTGRPIAAAGDESHKLALFMLARATSALHAVEVLLVTGLETDAMASLRIIAELVIDYEWIWKQDRADRVRLFVEHINIINHRRLTRWVNLPKQPPNPAIVEKLFARIDPRKLPPSVTTADEYMQWQEAEYQRVKLNYHEKKSWAGISIYQRAKECNLSDLYELQFVLGSEAAHSGAATLTGFYSTENGTVSVLYGPTVPSNPWALAHAAIAYGMFLRAVTSFLGLADSHAAADALSDEFPTTFYAALTSS